MKTYLICIATFFISSIVLNAQRPYKAYIFMAEDCPVCNYLGQTLKKLSKEYKDSIEFIAVFPQRRSNIKTASLFKQKYDLTEFNIEIDAEQNITKRYQAKVTPEVVLVNQNDKILYKGRINDSYAAPGRIRHGRVNEDLEQAIQTILRQQIVNKPWPDPIGCYITLL